jgi:CheY-like chemotaxis protein
MTLVPKYVKLDASRGSRAPRCVLVVDHDVPTHGAAERVLATRGFEVRVAAGAIEAMFVVEAARPDIVLCELGLPGVDGIVLAEALKRDGSPAAVTVVGFTERPELAELAAHHGRFDALVQKPLDWHALADLLDTLLANEPATTGSVPGPPATRATVLVTDDDSDLRDTLAEILEDGGMAVLTAENGQEALHVLKSGRVAVDMMLLDLMMPVMDGWTVLARMQRDEELRHIPVIVMTAGGAPALATLPASQPRLAKPLTVDQLLGAVGAVLPRVQPSAG